MKYAINPKRKDNFLEWYQQVIKESDIAENSPTRGCMIIKPWGYSIWENIQNFLNSLIKNLGHENLYFPLLIPKSFFEKESQHVEGFATECAVVTHHKLKKSDGLLVPCGKLDEPYVIRPTSETIIGHSFSKWIKSYRDLPIKINQWANVVRWEMRPRIFLRTAEILWQEGHTAHANEKEAIDEAETMLETYYKFCNDFLAIPSIKGVKSHGEKFPGAENTYTIEMMMQDGKALQGATSHYLGSNFSKAFNIKFSDENGSLNYTYTTSWGITTRLLGAIAMVHGDDNGLRIPPQISGKQIVIIPFFTSDSTVCEIKNYTLEIKNILSSATYSGKLLEVIIDDRELRGGERRWQWIKKGIPIIIEIGPKDISKRTLMMIRRDDENLKRSEYSLKEIADSISLILDDIQNNYLKSAKKFLNSNIHKDIDNFDSAKKHFKKFNGFVEGFWCGNANCEKDINNLGVSIRCILDNNAIHKTKRCLVCGTTEALKVIYAKAY